MSDIPSRSARIVLSSTIRDFGEKCDLLVRRVFPALGARPYFMGMLGEHYGWIPRSDYCTTRLIIDCICSHNKK
jgi:hypothetical protein